MKNLLSFIFLHSDITVVRITETAVFLASPAVQCDGDLRCPCTSLSGPISTIKQAREWLGY